MFRKGIFCGSSPTSKVIFEKKLSNENLTFLGFKASLFLVNLQIAEPLILANKI